MAQWTGIWATRWAEVACALALFAASATRAGACPVSGTAVVLRADELDPDVFVWDSLGRLEDFENGRWITRDVFVHTVLVDGGTSARVLRCRPAVLRARGGLDAVDVRVTNGTFAGRTGWIASSGMHEARPVAAHRRAP